MKNEKRINREIEKTMQSLDNIKPAGTDPYFFSRLEAKLENRKSPNLTETVFGWGIAALILIIVMNVMSVLYYTNSNTDADNITANEETSRDYITAIADDYALTPSTVYEQNEAE